MLEYIEREAFLKLFDGYGWGEECDGEKVLNMLCEFPTADVAPVVHCKHCTRRRFCKLAQRLGEDGFCSEGERRSE